MGKLKDLFIGWIVKDQLGGLVKKLDGHKTTLGFVLLLLQLAGQGFDGGALFQTVIDGIQSVGAANPLNAEETNAVFAAGLTLYGAAHKLWKRMFPKIEYSETDKAGV